MFRILIVLFCTVISFGCDRSIETSEMVTPAPLIASSPQSLGNSTIEKFDFKNFTYKGPVDYPVGFRLKNGEKSYVPNSNGRPEEGYSLENVYFSDLTADGEKEAVVVISIQTGGSAMPDLVFVYAADVSKPKEIWKFMTGDRAEGGLKDIAFQNGNLVVELFGDSKYANGKWDSTIPKTEGLCCPSVFTRTTFHWDGKRFVVFGKPEIFQIDNRNIKE